MRVGVPWWRRYRREKERDLVFEGLQAQHAETLTVNATLRQQLVQWQEHGGKLFTENEQLRRDAEHWRSLYEMALDGIRAEREALVGHIVDLKREGFGVAQAGFAPAPTPETLPPEIERAIGMRGFDDVITRQNRAYAIEQLRYRPDATTEIAKEILAGEQLEAYADSEDAPL